MKNNKLWLTVVFLSAIYMMVDAQSRITVEASQQYTTFSFKNAAGNSLNSEYTGLFAGSFGLGYQYTLDNGVIFCSRFGIRNAGANLEYDEINYSWKLQYANGSLGSGYKLDIGGINPYLTASGYFGYLMNGTQTLNNETFNIMKRELLNRIDYGVLISPGVEFELFGETSAFISFNYLLGLANLEKDVSQEAKNSAYSISVGLSIPLTQ